MANHYYGTPLLIEGGTPEPLSRVMIGDLAASDDLSEDYIRNLAFDFPSCLPVNEIDTGYRNPIPVCKELSTPAGPLDALMITANGRLVIIEAKLWRNPEARRKVIGQILDYAKELQRWQYDDLQREVARATGRKGNVLYEIARSGGCDMDESNFVDTVSRSLKRGQFLLLVVGDGIKEGAASIASFLQQTGTSEYTLGMVEMAIYQRDGGDLFVQPRVLAKTEIIERSIFEIRDDRIAVDSDSAGLETEIEETENQRWSREFWSELLGKMTLDDPQQPMASPNNRGFISFPMPPNGNQMWVSAYFLQDRGLVGVNLRLLGGEKGDRFFNSLLEEKDEIEKEIGTVLEWEDTREKGAWACLNRVYGRGQTKAPENREEILEFLGDTINRFVNTFRPRLKRMSEF